jgi:hypothetical protein
VSTMFWTTSFSPGHRPPHVTVNREGSSFMMFECPHPHCLLCAAVLLS